MRRTDPVVGAIEKRAQPKQEDKKDKLLVPSGSVLLNLACSHQHDGAFELGRLVNLIGDSSTGKTYLAMEMLAQCAADKRFDDYKLILDDAECAMSMDIQELFGDLLADRIEAPFYDEDGEEAHSTTVEDFHVNIMDVMERHSCIYVLDSLDALSSLQEEDEIEDMRDAMRSGKDVKGTYGMSKPKYMSKMLKDVCSRLEKTNSFLLIISQTRDNISPGNFNPKVRSGGRALKFYASHEIWLSVFKTDKGGKNKDRVIGTTLKANITKNKLTGNTGVAEFYFRKGYGIDDIYSCIEYLIKEDAIKGGKGNTKLEWNGIVAQKAKAIAEIENQGLEKDLFDDVEDVWVEIADSLKPKRKRKY